jgi:hypothetical protein
VQAAAPAADVAVDKVGRADKLAVNPAPKAPASNRRLTRPSSTFPAAA